MVSSIGSMFRRGCCPRHQITPPLSAAWLACRENQGRCCKFSSGLFAAGSDRLAIFPWKSRRDRPGCGKPLRLAYKPQAYIIVHG
jgi:hypothetical protein